MKKSLSLLVAIAMVFSMFATVVSANEAEMTTEEKYAALETAGLFNGFDDGEAHLDENMTRAQAAKIIALLTGYTTDMTVADAGFTDLVGAGWATDYINYVANLGIVEGIGNDMFDPSSEVTIEQLAKMVVEAFIALDFDLPEAVEVEGEVSEWATDYVGIAIAAGFMTAQADYTASASRGLLVEASYTAYVAVTVPAEVMLESVTAVGSKSIEVKFNKAVSEADAVITVKKGNSVVNVSSIKFAEDMMSATIEFSTNLTTGTYAVSVTGLSEDALTGSAVVTSEKIAKIEFATDVAVISGTNVTTTVKAENQYGENVTAKLASATVTATTSKGTGATINNKGQLTITNGTAFTVGEKVVVTVVDSATGLVSTQTLTVAQAANVQSIELGELTTDKASLKDKAINITAMTTNAGEYYIPVTVKDQYGNVLSAGDLAGVSVLSSNDHIAKLAATPIVDVDGKTVVKFQTADATATYGTVVITIVSAGTGVTANATLQVQDNAKIDMVTMESPASELKLSTATELPVTVVDSYGEVVTLKSLTITGTGTSTLTLAAGSTITAINATLSTTTDYVAGTTVIKVTPTAKNVILTATTATGKAQTLSLTANDAPVVAGIKEIKSNFVKYLANDVTLSTTLAGSNIQFVDQYGSNIVAPAYDATDATAALDFTVAPKSATNTVTTNVNNVITASTTAGTEVYVVTLKNAAGDVLDTQEVTVTIVDASKLTEFGISDLKKFYTGAASVSHNQDVDIYGMSNGNKVVVNQSMAVDFYATNGLTGIDQTTGAYTAGVIATTNADKTSTIRVLVEAGANTYTVTKDVVYSDAAPKAESLTITPDAPTVQATVTAAQIVTAKNDGVQIVAKDQYGVDITTGFTFVITNDTTGAGYAISTGGLVSTTGAPTVGQSFTINATIGDLTKSIKVIIG